MVIGTATERIEVSLAGMRELHIGRHPVELIKELVQNAFDEDSANSCTVKVHYESGEGTLVVVSDNGDGFKDVRDVWTLLGTNPKRRFVNKRGRFNAGDKEVLAVAIWAKVETVGFSVLFPKSGGRTSKQNKRKSGTVFSVMMPWDGAQAEDLVDRLRLIRPPQNCTYKVNGKVIKHPTPLVTHEATLETVLQDGPGEPMRKTRRLTMIQVSKPVSPDGIGMIYEMGIPIQPIEPPYDVDIQQKVPMPPNRDTVRESYLQDIYAEVLNAMHPNMPDEEFGETWVRTATEDNRLTEDAAKETVRSRYGDKVVMWSSDKPSNLEALDAGYEVLHPRTMSAEEREQLREKGGLQSAYAVFGDPARKNDFEEVDISGDTIKQAFSNWVTDIGALVGMDVIPQFIKQSGTRVAADCTMNTTNPVMRFNLDWLDDEFFMGRSAPQLRLIIHEFGHATLNGEMEHGMKWGTGCAIVGARLASSLSLDLKQSQDLLCAI